MNFALWALTAARKGKTKPVVPGSSGFIVDETTFNLRATKEAKTELHSVEKSCLSTLNNIIDAINRGPSFEELDHLIQSSQPPIQSPEESFRSSSTIAKSEFDDLYAPGKPELLLQQGEKVISGYAGPVLAPVLPDTPAGSRPPYKNASSADLGEDDAKVTEEGRKEEGRKEERRKEEGRKEERRKEDRRNVPSSVTRDSGVKVKLEFMSHDANVPPRSGSKSDSNLDFNLESDKHNNDIKSQHSAQLREPAERFRLNNQTVLPYSTNTKSNEFNENNISDPSSFSPIKVVNGRVAPVTSPNADLSFIPIANTIDPNKRSGPHFKQPPEPELSASDDDADNSFQAISTAIRKSFAGKTSMGHTSGHPTSHDDIHSGHETSRPIHSHYPRAASPRVSNPTTNSLDKNTRVKLEHDSDPVSSPVTEKIPKSRSRSFNTSRYTATAFVSLPNRESIALQELDSTKPKSKVSASEGPNSSFHHEPHSSTQPITRAPALFPDPAVAPARMEDVQPQPIQQRQASPPALLQHIPKLLSTSNFSGAFRPSKDTKSPVKASKVSKSSPTRTERSNTRRPVGSYSRTTFDGSPVRRAPVSKQSPASRFTSTTKIAGSSVRLAASSSVNNSRSPTKYSQRGDRSSVRGTPTNFSIHETEELRKVEPGTLKQTKISPKASSTKSRKPTASENDFWKNRFSSTALLPTDSTKITRVANPEPLRSNKNHGKPEEGPSEGNWRDLGANGISKEPEIVVKKEIRPRPRITPNFQQQQSLRPANNSRLSAHHRAVSPQKKDKPKMERSRVPDSKGVNTLPNLSNTQSIPKKRLMGNAVPLPEAARGKLRKENPTHSQLPPGQGRNVRSSVPTANSRTLVRVKSTPDTSPRALPDIPSDDDVLRATKYIRSWAQTPEVLKVMSEKQRRVPKNVFGEFADLDMNDIFRSVKSQPR